MADARDPVAARVGDTGAAMPGCVADGWLDQHRRAGFRDVSLEMPMGEVDAMRTRFVELSGTLAI